MSNDLNNFNHAETQLIDQELFHFLTAAERNILLRQAKKITLKKGQTLVHEGDPGKSFFVILSGKIRVTKHAKNKKMEYTLAYFNAGDTIGEMTLIENLPRGATLKAAQHTTLLEFDIDKLKEYPEIYTLLSLYVAQRVAQRLRFLSEVTVKSMEKELEGNKKRRALGLLMVTVLTIICVYMLGLPFLQSLGKLHLPITTIISAPLTIILMLIMALVMKKSGFPWKTYGISFKNWRPHIVEALLLSIPIIIVLMAAKWAVIHLILKDPTIALISPESSLPNAKFNLMLYLISLLAYVIMSPCQELIVRGALQSGFYVFLLGSKKRRLWIAIIISNLIFSLPHLYRSPYFALLVLIPGLFWGWLYARQKTLVGVSVSHIFIGVWMIFVVGFEQLMLKLGSFL